MEYSRIDDAYYLRVAKGEHVPQAIVELCRREHVGAAQNEARRFAALADACGFRSGSAAVPFDAMTLRRYAGICRIGHEALGLPAPIADGSAVGARPGSRRGTPTRMLSRDWNVMATRGGGCLGGSMWTPRRRSPRWRTIGAATCVHGM